MLSIKRKKNSLRGATVVVTGAASGIGHATAIAFAKRGCNVAISDVDAAGLDETRDRVAATGAAVDARTLDVADRDAFARYAEAVEGVFGTVNVVVNNAGVAAVGTIKDMSYDDLEWVMDIDYWGVVYGTKSFLPALERAPWGHVVNVSSVFGFIAVPTQGAYNAAKFAVRGFTECLRQELEMAGSTVGVTCVHPGGIRTNIARNARMAGGETVMGSRDRFVAKFDRVARTTSEAAAAAIVDAVERDRPRLLIGVDARVIDWTQRLFPARYRDAAKWIGAR